MADYLKEHHGSVYFQIRVPDWIRHRFGNVKRLTERLGKYVEGKRDKIARQEALHRAGYYENRFKELATLEKADPAALEGVTDVRKLRNALPDLEARVARHIVRNLPADVVLTMMDRGWIADPRERVQQETFQRSVLNKVAHQERDELAQLDRLKAVPLATEPDPQHTWDALYRLWLGKGCKRATLHTRALALLKEHFGNVDFRKITKPQMKAFRNWLGERVDPKTKKLIPLQMQRSLMSAVKGMYTIAADKLPDLDESPADGVSVKVGRNKRGHFTGAQIKTIHDKVLSERWGGKRHEEVKWIVWLATYQGLRVNEIAQLKQSQVGVAKLSSGEDIGYLDIRQGDGQSLKTGKMGERKLPLHPECKGFVEFAKRPKFETDGSPSEFVFAGFHPNPSNGRAYWIMNNFATFRREVCGITNDKLTFHSLRHSFVTARRKAGISAEMGEFLVGHAPSTTEGGYGGTDIEGLYNLIHKIDPLTIAD